MRDIVGATRYTGLMASREDPAPPASGAPNERRLYLALGVGLACGATIAALAAWLVPDPPAPVLPPPVVRPTPSVITSIRELSRLESATAHVERIIDMTDDQDLVARHLGIDLGIDIPGLHSTDTILLVAAADVTAGVDLSTLTDGAVVVDEATDAVTITLPRATVLSTAVDEEHTYVHSRDTDMLASRREDLETLARREASTSLEAAAIEGGLLDRADTSAARTVEALVRSLGHANVTVRRAD